LMIADFKGAIGLKKVSSFKFQVSS